MDPTTTLITFMLLTHPSVQTVHLVGSWDNFSKTYAMERDSRRDRGQWRGCHSFKDIICDGDDVTGTKRSGGLKMGNTYYYYYELDGAVETHDPSLPSTTACPYLPGQKVNTLFVPVERAPRKRSASLNAMRYTDLKTMNPQDKYVTPRPPPPVPGSPGTPRLLGSSPVAPLRHVSSSRSLSPAPAAWPWSPRRLFSRRSTLSREDEPAASSEDDDAAATADAADHWRSRSRSRSSAGGRSRDLSPESLRRFLADDGPAPPFFSADQAQQLQQQPLSPPPDLVIPEDIAEEEDIDDDANFATTGALSDAMLYTGLSPPPARPRASSSASTLLLLPARVPEPPTRPPPALPTLAAHPAPPTLAPPPPPPPSLRFELSPDAPDDDVDDDEEDNDGSGAPPSPLSPLSPDDADLPSFYLSESEEDYDDVASSRGDVSAVGSPDGPADADAFGKSLLSAFAGYRLPPMSQAPAAGADAKLAAEGGVLSAAARPAFGSPALLASNGSDLPVGNTSLLAVAAPPASGLDELVNELGWMADVIRGKD